MRLDEDYLSLVCKSINHASKAIQIVTTKVLADIENDPYISHKKLPTRLEVLLGRTSEQTEPKLSTDHKSEGSHHHLLRNHEALSSESESSINPLQNQPVRNPKQVVSSSNIKNILLPLPIPERFNTLRESQQQGILKTIKHLPPSIQQQVFQEWDDRCRSQAIRNPAAYLYGIIQKALKGELNELSTPTEKQPLPPSPSPIPEDIDLPYVVDKERIKAYIDNMKRIISTGTN